MNGNQISRNTVTHFFLKNTHIVKKTAMLTQHRLLSNRVQNLESGIILKIILNKRFKYLFLKKFHVREENVYNSYDIQREYNMFNDY